VPWTALLTTIPVGLIIVTDSTAMALVLLALTGMLTGPQGAAQFTVRDRFSPPPVRTQVFTLSTSIKTTFAALGAALAGFISGAPPSVILGIAVAANLIGGGIALFDLVRHGSHRPRQDDIPTGVAEPGD
jgi:homoserine kinase